MTKKKLSYLYRESFEKDCQILKSRGVPFEIPHRDTIEVSGEFEAVLVEFQMSALLSEDKFIHIMNNDDERFGHTKENPLSCPKVASELFVQAKKESRSWYYVIR